MLILGAADCLNDCDHLWLSQLLSDQSPAFENKFLLKADRGVR
jgi:hypothetical protein